MTQPFTRWVLSWASLACVATTAACGSAVAPVQLQPATAPPNGSQSQASTDSEDVVREHAALAAACAETPRSDNGSTCAADEIIEVGTPSDGSHLFVVRTLPYGPCDGRAYCTNSPGAGNEDPSVPLTASYTYEPDSETAREWHLDEGCVPMFFMRVRWDREHGATARRIARVCTPMSAAGSSTTFRVYPDATVSLTQDSAASWFASHTAVAQLFPMRLLRSESSGSSRTYLCASTTSRWDYEHAVGTHAVASEYCETHSSNYLTVPQTTQPIAWNSVRSLGSCSAALREEAAILEPARADAPSDAPRVLMDGDRMVIEMNAPGTLELVRPHADDNRTPNPDEQDCSSEVDFRRATFRISNDANVSPARNSDAELLEFFSVTATAVPHERMRVVVTRRLPPARRGPEIASLLVRVDNFSMYAPNDATAFAALNANMHTRTITCVVENGALTAADGRSCESDENCTLDVIP